MKIRILRNIVLACFFLLLSGHASAQDSIRWLSGSFYTEANYGYNFFGEHRNVYDFPHAVLDLNVNMGRGWSFTTEQEFEYLSDSGDWPHQVSDMYVCNWAYFQKDFKPWFKVQAGILNVPIGLTSSFLGTGLTVYDPLAEGRLLPMKWHEDGVALTGELGKFEYWLGYIGHIEFPLKESRSMGGAVRVNYRPIEGLRVGVDGFIGEGSKHSKLARDGMVEAGEHACYVGADYNYDRGRWISSGEVVYLSTHDNIAISGEVGYRVTSNVTPFVRYDWLKMPAKADYEVTTVGVNYEPIKNLCLKGQISQESRRIRTDFSVNYTLDF